MLIGSPLCSAHQQHIQLITDGVNEYCDKRELGTATITEVEEAIVKAIEEELGEINKDAAIKTQQLKYVMDEVERNIKRSRRAISDAVSDLTNVKKQLQSLLVSPGGWYQTKCGVLYKLFKTNVTYEAAREECEKMGATLAYGLNSSGLKSELVANVVSSGGFNTWVERLGSDPCGWLDSSDNWSINDHNCTEKFYYLCQMEE
ncbi:uncharacterized protein LOC120346311 [Styela clava]